ncbi:ABC transporter ATP-binding protein [Variovorax sp. Sphag1AA]|uniref:ABC transporter ATP-binding protein n=1 Tax=Variovorax sp. Sphag1AA TaxID=2587027 RepID=UPI001856C57C|nr:ABC transporter ATP-binding protein [Variovorax sp. Sphag1AA]MBB3182026.1 simple sugar transport system ATP-binding protein [Variovorax sp. Sphag1AA]
MSDNHEKSTSPPRLELRGLTKIYPSLIANDKVDLVVQPGEIHAVLGENGAGKSTLMKSIYGVVKPDAGQILWDGQRVNVTSPAHARSLGIGMVFQHFSLFETLTVTENAALGLPGKPDLGDLARRIEAVSLRYGLAVDPQRLVHSLSVGERQRVEIIRCMLQNPRLLIMDEPTSVLTPQAVEKLFDTLRLLADGGCSILYISHKLHEIKALCHTATVLRGGRVVGHCDPRRETEATMARLMVGQEVVGCRPAAKAASGPDVLVVKHLTHRTDDPFGTDLEDVSFTVRGGEIVGIAGVSGNGQQELLGLLSGESSGHSPAAIQILGTPAGHLGPAARRRLGMGYVPEERLGRGAVPGMSLLENALLTADRKGLARHGLIDAPALSAFAQRCIADFNVKCRGPHASADSLSGGNLQKFIVGREILQMPKLLVVAQPTWGVDIQASAFVRRQLVELRDAGVAVLVISDDLDELFEICDGLLVIAEGRLSPVKRREDTNVEEVGLWMSGLWSSSQAVTDQPGIEEVRQHAAQT